MEFRPTDHASEKQLKLDVIAVYNHRLDEREKRKKFVIEHNLLDYKKPPAGGKKRGRVSLIFTGNSKKKKPLEAERSGG